MPQRSHPTRATLTLLLACAGLALGACGAEEPSAPEAPSPAAATPEVSRPSTPEISPPASTPTPAPPAHAGKSTGIVWTEGFAKGAAAAKSLDEVLFVYVGRRSPT